MSSFDYFKEVEQEFDSATDRGAAVICGAFLDEILLEILLTFMISDEKRDRDLFDGNGPLSTFSSKIHLTYRLGLISDGEMKLLHSIRGIRNEFAHRLDGLSFTAQSIADRCKAMAIPPEMITPATIPLPREDGSIPKLIIEKASTDDPRALFREAVFHLMNVLSGRLVDAMEQRRHPQDEYQTATEPRERLIEYLEAQLDQHRKLRKELIALGGSVSEDSDPDLRKYEMLIKVTKYSIDQIKAAKA